MKRHIMQSLALLSLLLNTTDVVQAEEIKIAAAASLTFALKDISKQFQEDTGHKLKISFASSGTLAHQIIQGAPFEIFLSADESYIEKLHQQNVTANIGKVYAYGQLAIFSSHKTEQPSADLSVLKQLLDNKSIKHFSIPNPKLAPYGKVAKQALKQAGIWETATPLLILGENASQSAMFVNTHSVDGALLPYSLALVLHQKGIGQFQLVSEHLYSKLNQRMVMMRNASKTAHSFYHYLSEPKAQRTLTKHGFGTILTDNKVTK